MRAFMNQSTEEAAPSGEDYGSHERDIFGFNSL